MVLNPSPIGIRRPLSGAPGTRRLGSGQWILLGGLVGIVSGLGAIVFDFMVNGCIDLFFIQGIHWMREPVTETASVLRATEGFRYWILPLVPALGGLLGALLVYFVAPEAEGDGTDGYIRAFHRQRGRIRLAVPFVKTLASAVTIGSGGSAGREGPISQIGAGFGSWLGQMFRLDAQDCRLLMVAGTAGGVAAIFCAPFGGALFAIEVLYRNQDMETEGLIPAIVSAVVSFSVFSLITGQTQAFHTPKFQFHPVELLPYAVLGVICALVGILYITVLHGLREYVFRRIPLPRYLIPMLGGLAVGLLALVRPEVMTGGYGWIESALNRDLPLALMISLVFAKVLATGLTISSGGSGGVFGPSLFIGSMLGASVGTLVNTYVPGLIYDPRSFALVGMVGFFGGIAKVPVASLLMVTEMSQSYELLVPMMLVVSFTYVLTDRWVLYDQQVAGKADSPAHLGEYRVDVLSGLHVRELELGKDCRMIPYNLTLRQMLPLILESSQNVFPVQGDDGRILGVFSTDDLRTLMLENQMYDLIVAMDVLNHDFKYVTPEEDLHSVLRKLTMLVAEEIPVMDLGKQSFLGVIKRRDILTLYSKRLYEIEQS